METPEKLLETMHKELKGKNITFRIVPIKRLKELEMNMNSILKDKVASQIIVDFVNKCFNYDYRAKLPDAKSIIIASVRDVVCRLKFMRDDVEKNIIVAPGYMKLPPDQIKPKEAFTVYFGDSYKIEPVSIPAKMLAVRSGLAKYGKNNISYVEGYGSFHKIVMFVSDFPAFDNEWNELNHLDGCTGCTICAEGCPTGAICRDKFIIDAEKCITYHNENDDPFPDWIKKEWHNCLLGCMLCQKDCPYNAEGMKNISDRGSFTETETEEFLTIYEFDKLCPTLQSKIADLGYKDFYKTLARNLRVLF